MLVRPVVFEKPGQMEPLSGLEQSFLVVVVGCAGEPTVAGLQVTVRSMIRHWHIKDIVVGLLVMIIGVIALAVAFPLCFCFCIGA
jgi:hypothetical protein